MCAMNDMKTMKMDVSSKLVEDHEQAMLKLRVKLTEELKYTESTSEILKVAEEKINYYKVRGDEK